MYTKIPKINAGVAMVNNAVVAGDAVLANGVLSVLNADTTVGLKFKLSDGLSYTKTAYSAGVKSIKTVQFSGVSMIADSLYSLSITLPNRQAFFGGGVEANQLIAIRTYTVGVDGTPTTTELKDAFVAKIQNDLTSGVVVASTGATTMTITMTDVNSGDTVVDLPTGATISTGTAYVAPSGTEDEVKLYVASSLVLAGGEYTKYVFKYRKGVRHNLLSGLQAIKEEIAIVFIEENAAGFGAFETAIDAMLDGTHATVADYLGMPA